MPAPKKISELVALFHSKKHELTDASYKEFSLQMDFLNSLFAELGWDIKNRAGLSEASRDVIQQYALRVGLTTTAPDYSFGIGHERKFIVEAKKPSVDLKHDAAPAMQARSYGWNAGLPLAILTDFEEFAVYDCRIRPKKADKPTTARIFYCTYEEYAERWEEISGIFSREAVVRGDFDTFANTKTKHRGTDTVDDALLKDIDEWRRLLATNIAIRNEALTEEQVNYAVQKIIDRILFLRICEDRGIEQWGMFLGQTNGTGIYGRVLQQFRHADQRYNSGLFHFHEESGISESPDTITPTLSIDDKILKQIITSLYPPESPYNFAVLPAEILGQVYEQFLGKVIRLTAGHHAKVEEKPEVHKAGGVYYTPAYIVEYIVEKTVGKLLEGKTPKQAAKLTIVDPACGSGSFLLGAYQKLLDWHLEYYAAHTPEKCKKELYKGKSGDWKLTTAERKRILLANIYGVDIDSQAVEVTKLSLLLKVLEGEDEETLGKQLNMFKERVLPSLSDNIQCGNSLIGSDFSDGAQPSLLGDEEPKNINPFDWEHAFPEIFRDGGFDAVIGNPPYIRIQTMQEFAPETIPYYARSYQAAQKGNYDIYVVFVEKGLQLLNLNGVLGYILPHKFFNAQYGEPIRKIISDGKHLQHVVHFGDQQVFKGATTYTCLMFLSKTGSKACEFVKVNDIDSWRHSSDDAGFGSILAKQVSEKEWNFVAGKGAELFERLKEMPVNLGDVANIFQGLVTGADGVFTIDSKVEIESELAKPLLLTGNLLGYSSPKISSRIIFPYELNNGRASLLSPETMENKSPKCWNHLLSHQDKLKNRERGKWHHEKWYAFGRSQNLVQMEDAKLIIQVTAQKPVVLFDDKGLYMTGGGSGPFYGIRPKNDRQLNIKYLLSILNSTLFGWIVRSQSTNLRGGYVKFSKQYIESTPIFILNIATPADKARHDRIVTLVDRMLDLHKRLAAAKTPHEQDQLKRQISATDKEIDELVFDLYELTGEEREIVLQASS